MFQIVLEAKNGNWEQCVDTWCVLRDKSGYVRLHLSEYKLYF